MKTINHMKKANKKIIKYLPVFFIMLLCTIQIASASSKISPMTVDGATSITTDEAKKLFDDGVLFIDVRSTKAWNIGRISDAVLLDIKSNYTEASLTAEAKKTDPIVIYCNGEDCLRSAKGSKMAVGWGFTKIYYYRNGFPAWKKAGYPIE
ncbi:MAG: rhodanese-like domain-containing protein [gamma proteobacterium symbiont of Taylorina sp.]|nr:rhodanese-like domain-containing protein [gamma proteobacterium symbiont of Taylorina sp.]